MKKQKQGEEGRNTDEDDGALDRSDIIMTVLNKYSRWRRNGLLMTSKLSMKHLLLRTIYLTACILADGAILPVIIIAMNRTAVSYLVFIVALGFAIFLESRFYLKWKARWKELGGLPVPNTNRT
ncbi:MAG: hypothetical protein ABSE39_01500 [Candidatus Bathyarchaeia archaeon]|jgi:hypothetical protein